MSQNQGTVLRNGKIIDSSSDTTPPEALNMAQTNSNDSETNDGSDISSQLSEIKESYERRISELHQEFSQLKDLMMAIVNKNNGESQSSSSKGLSKPPQQFGFDMVTGVTKTRSIRPTSSFTNFRRYQEYDTDEATSRCSTETSPCCRTAGQPTLWWNVTSSRTPVTANISSTTTNMKHWPEARWSSKAEASTNCPRWAPNSSRMARNFGPDTRNWPTSNSKQARTSVTLGKSSSSTSLSKTARTKHALSYAQWKLRKGQLLKLQRYELTTKTTNHKMQ